MSLWRCLNRAMELRPFDCCLNICLTNAFPDDDDDDDGREDEKGEEGMEGGVVPYENYSHLSPDSAPSARPLEPN